MLTWMLFSTAIGAALVASAVLAEPLVRLGGRATRFLWLFVVLATLGWPAVVVVSDRSLASRDTAALRSLPAGSSETSAFVAGSVSSAQDAMTLAKRITIAVLPEPSAGLDMLLLGLWLLGSLVCVATLGVSAWRITRMRREWDRSVIAGIPVLVSHDVGPAVIGLVHHGIVVPRWVESLDDEAQRLVMLHEREHVRAGDPLLLWGAALLVSLMPWNAALWFALRRTRHAIEIDCDARVLTFGHSAADYGEVLLEVGQRQSVFIGAVAAMSERVSFLEQRIRIMMSVPSRWRRISTVTLGALSVAIAAVAAGVAPPNAVSGVAANRDAADTSVDFLPDHRPSTEAPTGIPPEGGEAALRELVEGIVSGAPTYAGVTPDVVQTLQKQLATSRSGLRANGQVQSIEYRGVGSQGWATYEVRQERGTTRWRITLAGDGKISGALVQAGRDVDERIPPDPAAR